MEPTPHPSAPEAMDPAPELGRPPSARKRMVVMLLGVAGLMGLLVGFQAFKGAMMRKAMAGGGEPPETVGAVEAREETWQPTLGAVGTLRAVRGADLAFEVAGVVVRVDAQPGGEVKAGQPLVALDDTAELAQLQQLKAAEALAELTHRRAKEQLAVHIISQAEFDTSAADLKAKQAAVASQAATAAKKRLVAPFPGRVGLVTTSPGAYLNAGASALTLQQLDPVYVDFRLPQRHLAAVRPGQKVEVNLDAYPGKTFTGRVTAVDSKVDGATRNVAVEATLANPQRLLMPGMFANVSMDVGTQQSYLTLPQTAITYNPYGAVVFLVKKGKVRGPGGEQEGLVAEQSFVTAGPTRGDQVAILEGLKPGDRVVTSGGLKLRNGTPLIVDNKALPANDPNPKPQER